MSQKKTEQTKSFEERVIEVLEKMDKRGDLGLDSLVADLRTDFCGPAQTAKSNDKTNPPTVEK